MRSLPGDTLDRTAHAEGSVGSGGAITYGIGFIVSKGGVGAYTVTLLGFKQIRSLVSTIQGQGWAYVTAMNQPNTFTVNLTDKTGAALDYPWQFIAEGVK